jgi:cytoplasmic tRNA 2-thiolation protein 1
MVKCYVCEKQAQMKRPKTGQYICKPCFFDVFEKEVHDTIMENKLFKKGDKVAIGASGGKDSTVLAYLMKLLNERHDYGIELFLLSIDEGIKGYRDDSLDSVKRNKESYQLPLKILSYKDLYGWSMDEIVREIGLKNNCTFCGVFRRQALDRGCEFLKVDMLLTGHNADDFAETILMNLLRGDIPRLERCTNIVTHDESSGGIPRAKPFKYTYQKEIVMYAYYKKLDYFSTECVYSPHAYRGYARDLIKDLERVDPLTIINILKSGESFAKSTNSKQELSKCVKCGYISSQSVCRACVFLDGLNKGKAKLCLDYSDPLKK